MKKIRAAVLDFVVFVAVSAVAFCQSQPTSLQSLGTTYNLAQVAAWPKPGLLVVGRWDGSLSVFRPPASTNEYGPVIIQALKSPSGVGVQMIARLLDGAFVTSNDKSSLAVWNSKNGEFRLVAEPKYDERFGVANSGDLIFVSGKNYLVTGHEQGDVLIWEVTSSGLTFRNSTNIRSSAPIPSPYQLWNVRSVVRYQYGIAITGAEDGDLCLVEIPSGKILSRKRYNPDAQRGINSLSLEGNLLLVGNCSVGRADKNLWLWTLQGTNLASSDSLNLIVNTNLSQVFDFCVQFAPCNGRDLFFASTQEGLLWAGEVIHGKLVSLGCSTNELVGGAALAFEPQTAELGVIEHDVHLYKVTGATNNKK
jgi:WD40 repeat protein